jgi:hypothetical protein
VYCNCYSKPGVLQPSPLKKSRPEITKEERSSENKERSLNHFFGLSGTKIGLITFLIPRSGTCLPLARIADGNKLQCGVNIDTTAQQKG